ncbi:DUF5372 family protein [Sphaerimonospora thailandensis]|uniref:Uncharacterized protein n=1 Tax=Sphaerimonospora thailandensis TaxID=795644 RepID=A0A8J3RCE5_9ACTN|nr:DUF5372 family protein [Sphaerimonospora thailandensis]GIH73541.1 hypothetical protein Mth01_57940 [Sphaerimonospora thailandensis]
MTHRFHPLFGQVLEFVKRRNNYGNDDRVYVYDTCGELVSLPAEWTDVIAEDPFVVMADGRAAFRTDDLLKLADLIAQISTGQFSAAPQSVKRITP